MKTDVILPEFLWKSMLTHRAIGPINALEQRAMAPSEEMVKMFTDENTSGYTAEQLAALNAELAVRLSHIPEDDTDTRECVEKAFSHEVARR